MPELARREPAHGVDHGIVGPANCFKYRQSFGIVAGKSEGPTLGIKFVVRQDPGLYANALGALALQHIALRTFGSSATSGTASITACATTPIATSGPAGATATSATTATAGR